MLGPQAQEILMAFLDWRPNQFLFWPRETDEWRRQHRPLNYKADRKTPVYQSELKRRERDKTARQKRIPKRPKSEQYNTASYRRVVN